MTCKVIRPHVLILASRYDIACDFVVSRLRRRSVSYLRLNSEDLHAWELSLDPVRRRFTGAFGTDKFEVTENRLISVFYRRPVFLRDYGGDTRSPSERFSHLQWAAFVRNLMLFKDAYWMNNPTSTYQAEQKAVQLATATRVGFLVPETRVTNTLADLASVCGENDKVAVKGLDTVLVRTDRTETFGFTLIESAENLARQSISSAPTVLQKALTNKLDLRVTVVADRVFCAAIAGPNGGFEGDWRAHKAQATYKPYELPTRISELCRGIVREFGLSYGAIDLAFDRGEYYFLEINPTGEWAWLVDRAHLPIDSAIAESLAEAGGGCGR